MPIKGFEEHTTHPASNIEHADALMRRLNNTTKPVRSHELERLTGLGPAALRDLVHRLRVKGHPICSSTKGYWIGTREEVLDSADNLEQRARSISEAADELRKCANRMIDRRPRFEGDDRMGPLKQMEMF